MRLKGVYALIIFVLSGLFGGCPAEDPETAGNYPETLVGTKWKWDSSFGIRTLEFDSPDHLIFYNDHRDEAEGVLRLNDYYTYDSATGQGEISGEYPAGPFYITNNNQTMYFTDFKSYGHGAAFTRIN